MSGKIDTSWLPYIGGIIATAFAWFLGKKKQGAEIRGIDVVTNEKLIKLYGEQIQEILETNKELKEDNVQLKKDNVLCDEKHNSALLLIAELRGEINELKHKFY